MTKEELYSAIESFNDKGLTVANELKAIEDSYTGEELTAKLDEIRSLKAQADFPGDEIVRNNIITLCDMIDGNG